jgi:serine/threonine-protein kinase
VIGRRLSHFEITDRLGAGGMGEVYLARDTRLERKVALKVLPEVVADDPERLGRLVREARALAALDHPNIVTVFSVDEADGVHFLTMAYVEGRTLEALIPPQGMEIEQLLGYAIPLADALCAAHEQGIIHRDLKPANVMVDAGGRLRVLDFGLAKRDLAADAKLSQVTTRGGAEAMTHEGAILGSYPYMSPEQAEGRPVDSRSDLFSLGTMLYEMACGRRPFAGDNGIAVITAILRDEPPPLTRRRPGLPRGLVDAIGTCLEKDPAQRYGSARELRSDLEAVLRAVRQGTAERVGPVPREPSIEEIPGARGDGAVGSRERSSATAAAAPPSPGEREHGATPGRRGWLRQLAGAAALVAVVLVSIWLARERPWDSAGSPPAVDPSSQAAPRVSSIAVLPFVNLTGEPAQDFFVDGMTEALITDLSKIGALKVIARSSAMRYKGTEAPLAEIAAELGVDAVVEGSVVREGDRVAVSAQLIAADDGSNLWAERYERDLTSILSLQGEMARAIAGEIEVTLTPAEKNLLAVARPVDPRAYEASLKGNFHLQKFTPQDFQLALEYFQTAGEIDPGHALAHVGLAKSWVFANQAGTLAPREANPRVREPLERALELDDSSAEAHFVQACWLAWHDFDWQAAEREFRRTLELNPNHAEAHMLFSHFLTLMGRPDEGTGHALRSLELDPFNPFYQGLHAVQIGLTGNLPAAIDQMQRTHEMAPGFDFGRLALAFMLAALDRQEESLAETRTHFANVGDTEVVEALDRGESEAGFEGAMGALAATLEQRALTRWVPRLPLMWFNEHAGDVDAAIAWLEDGYATRDPNMPYIGALWFKPETRERPEFRELLRKLDLPDLLRGRTLATAP